MEFERAKRKDPEISPLVEIYVANGLPTSRCFEALNLDFYLLIDTMYLVCDHGGL